MRQDFIDVLLEVILTRILHQSKESRSETKMTDISWL